MTDSKLELKKSHAAFKLLCAFNGIEPEQCPDNFWWFHPNKNVRDAWLRVEEKARELYGSEDVS